MKYPRKYTYLDGGSFQKLIRKKEKELKWLMKCKLMLYACPLDSVTACCIDGQVDYTRVPECVHRT